MQMKTERFEMRLDRETLEQVDGWRAEQNDLPSRAEAVRRLIDAGLAVSGKGGVSLSDGEKLILMMLSDLYKHHRVDGEIDPKFVGETILGGHYWGLEWKYVGLFHNHVDSPRTVSEVVDVLDMWSFIESGYAKLSKKEKERVEAEAEPFGKHVEFSGFDGNNESEHIGIARFLIDDLDRFASFKGRELNSHMPSIDTYRRMLAVFEPMRRTLTGGELSVSQIIELLKAKTHPDYREG
ncbi:MAG: hypothetical protein Kow0032_07190 [Methyloligellaceae bacterium]